MSACRPALLMLAAWTACGGCARYHVGVDSLYPADVRTVYVPMFPSASYRRGLGELLTEAVIKEMEKRTTFKVVNTPNADSILTGRIVSDDKAVRIENRNDDPREVQLGMVVEVTWQNRKGDLIMQQDIPLPPDVVDTWGSSKIVPEVGQSVATGYLTVIQRLAMQIVDLMEVPWGEEVGPAFYPQ